MFRGPEHRSTARDPVNPVRLRSLPCCQSVWNSRPCPPGAALPTTSQGSPDITRPVDPEFVVGSANVRPQPPRQVDAQSGYIMESNYRYRAQYAGSRTPFSPSTRQRWTAEAGRKTPLHARRRGSAKQAAVRRWDCALSPMKWYRTDSHRSMLTCLRDLPLLNDD